MRSAIVGLFTCIALTTTAHAQKPTTEVWPELDVYWQPAVHQRTFFELASQTEREGTKHEASVGLYQDYVSLPLFYLRAGYRETFSVRDASYRESRIVTEATLRAYSTWLVRLVNRTRVEFRFINGAYSYRVRDRLHLQRLPQASNGLRLAPYGTFEAYYDSRYDTIDRLGARVGTEARLGGPVGIDVYIARQNNSRTEPRYVNAIGVTTKLSF